MRVLSILCLMLLLVTAAPGHAQVQAPLVVFVEEARTLVMASVTDNGPDGVTRLAEIFQSLGARTTWVRLDDPIPEDARVVVLVRPRGALTPAYLARIWLQVSAGNSLLVALEPPGYLGARTETPGSGLDRLLTYEQGISLLNGILVEPWFNNASFSDLYSTFSLGYADSVPNPISDPLRQYDLPVALWGARPLHVEPFGMDSFAWALVDASPEFVETATDIFPSRDNPGAPIQLNLDKDMQGRVNIAAYGENTRSGARAAVLGDGEMLQNGYGLRRTTSGEPVHPADYILAQRLAAWLLRLPQDQYPALPSGFTWIALDGSVSDWADNVPVTPDDPTDASILSLNIGQARAVYNDSYLYLTVETVSQANIESQIDLELGSADGGTGNTVVSMQPGRVYAQTGDQPVEVVPDADMSIGDVIELRLPLRLTGTPPNVVSLCLSSGRSLAFPQPPDCLDAPVQVGRIDQTDPAPVRAGDFRRRRARRWRQPHQRAPRAGDDSERDPYRALRDGFPAIGRSADGEWVQVQTAAYRGWVFRLTLFAVDSDLDLRCQSRGSAVKVSYG
ncbi:MAG: hypothetical protein U0703_16745 [Anaerolineae bacterium]